MANLTRVSSWVVGAAFGVVVALLIVPSTRGILLLQLRLACGASNPISNVQPTQQLAERYPNDFLIQLAASRQPYQEKPLDAKAEQVQIAKLAAFEARFPNNPSAYANVLRWISSGSFTSARPENSLVSGAVSSKPTEPSPSPALYAFFDQTAEEGERLDPNNAYFPFMRAAGLFGTYRDTDALAELHRAGQDSDWQEYYQDEIYGGWRVSDIQNGFKNEMARIAISAAILFPHYAMLRSVARIAEYKAMQFERSGDIPAAVAVRMDIMRSGSLMRVHSGSLIGSLVGIAISSIGTANCGGVVNLYSKNGHVFNNARSLRLNDYCTYLNQHGYGDLVPSVREESGKGDAVRRIISKSTLWDLENKDLLGFCYLWSIDQCILAGIVLLLLSASMTTAWTYSREFAALSPPKKMITVVAWLAVGVGLWIAVSNPNVSPDVLLGLTGDTPDSSPLNYGYVEYVGLALLLAGGASAASIVAIAVIRGGQSRTGEFIPKMIVRRDSIKLGNLARRALKTTAAFAAAALVIRVAYVEVEQSYSFANALGGGSPLVIGLVSGAALLPILLVIGISLFSGVRSGTPVYRRVLAGLRTLSMPIASVLVIAYGGVFLLTMKNQIKLNDFAGISLIDEGPAWAQSSGQSWPGPTNWVPLTSPAAQSGPHHTVK